MRPVPSPWTLSAKCFKFSTTTRKKAGAAAAAAGAATALAAVITSERVIQAVKIKSRWRLGSRMIFPAPAGLGVATANPSGTPGGPGTNTTTTTTTAASRGSLHRVLQPHLPEVDMHSEYCILRTLGEGCFARVVLAQHRQTQATVVLKAVHCELTPVKDFYREFHYAYRLSPHPAIVKAYSVAFRTSKDQCLVFASELAPLGDLAGLLRPGGLPESHVKRVAQQIGSALDFMHTSGLVHRDVKLENILVWTLDCSVVKLSDFGCTRVNGELATRPRGAWSAGLPPELSDAVRNERVSSHPGADVWSFAISLLVCLTGLTPWKTPDAIADPNYRAFRRWQKRRTGQIPPAFRRFTPRLLRMLRRLLDPHPEKRPRVTEINKYLKDSWYLEGSKTPSPFSSAAAIFGGTPSPSSGPFGKSSGQLPWLGGFPAPAPHSGPTEQLDPAKGRLRTILSSYGLDTNLDQKIVARRIWDWVQTCDTSQDETSDSI